MASKITKLPKVKDKKTLPPGVEHKVLTKLESERRAKKDKKKMALEKAKAELAKLNTGGLE